MMEAVKIRYNTVPVSARLKKTSLILLAVAVCALVLPFVAGEGRVVITLIAVANFLAHGQTAGVLLLLAFLLPCIAVGCLYLAKHAKCPVALVGFGLSVCGMLCAFLVLFNVKQAVDTVSYLGSGFLIFSNLNVAWYVLLASTTALACVIAKAIKINPTYILLCALSIAWIVPIFWIFVNSFRGTMGQYSSTFFPQHITFQNYIRLFTDISNETGNFMFGRWFLNTLIVAVCSMAVSTIIILCTAYTISRSKFRGKLHMISAMLIMGMFPGFMSMIAIYFILQGIGVGQNLIALIAIYSGSAALSFIIVKGFFDTLPTAIEEAAQIDGASKLRVFVQIMIPLSKPIIVYTLLTTFIAPWGDYIFAKIILGASRSNYTVAVGLHDMLTGDGARWAESWYTRFLAGSVLVSVPIAGLFIALQRYYSQGVSGAVKG